MSCSQFVIVVLSQELPRIFRQTLANIGPLSTFSDSLSEQVTKLLFYIAHRVLQCTRSDLYSAMYWRVSWNLSLQNVTSRSPFLFPVFTAGIRVTLVQMIQSVSSSFCEQLPLLSSRSIPLPFISLATHFPPVSADLSLQPSRIHHARRRSLPSSLARRSQRDGSRRRH